MLRSNSALDYTGFSLDRLSSADGVRARAVDELDPMSGGDTDGLLAGKRPGTTEPAAPTDSAPPTRSLDSIEGAGLEHLSPTVAHRVIDVVRPTTCSRSAIDRRSTAHDQAGRVSLALGRGRAIANQPRRQRLYVRSLGIRSNSRIGPAGDLQRLEALCHARAGSRHGSGDQTLRPIRPGPLLVVRVG